MTLEACEETHSFANRRIQWDNVSESQKSPWRHRCAACTYEQGYRDAIRDMRNNLFAMSGLDTSQQRLI